MRAVLAVCALLLSVVTAAAMPAGAATHAAAKVRLHGPAAGLVHHRLKFSVSTTLSGGDKAKTYLVNYGDGTGTSKHHGRPPKVLKHTFAHTGVFAVSVKLSDDHGKTVASSHRLTIDPATGTFDFYRYASRIPTSHQAGPFLEERGTPLDGDHVAPLTHRVVYSGVPGFAGPEHASDGGLKPAIFVNRGKAVTDSADVVIPAHSVLAHPGETAKYSPVIRFTNPGDKSATYTASATVTSLDGRGGDGVAGYLYQTSGGKVVAQASNDGAVSNAPPAGSTPEQSFTVHGTLPPHGSIYLAVGNNGTYNYDSAGIRFTVKLG